MYHSSANYDEFRENNYEKSNLDEENEKIKMDFENERVKFSNYL